MRAGDTVHRKMVFHERVKDFAVPFIKRIRTLSYKDPEKRIIKVSQNYFYVVIGHNTFVILSINLFIILLLFIYCVYTEYFKTLFIS